MALRESIPTTRLRDVKGALAVLVLEARAKKAKSLEVVLELPYVDDATIARAREFMERVAPDVRFRLEGRDGTKAGGAKKGEQLRTRRALPEHRGTPDLFSDMNQWLLKYLLLYAPEKRAGSLRALASVAEVSLPTAQRFVEAFTKIGHLVKADDGYRVVRRTELMSRWFGWWAGKSDLRMQIRSLFGRERLFKALAELRTRGVISAAVGGFAACASRGILHATDPGVPDLHLDDRGITELWKHARLCSDRDADISLVASSAVFKTSVFRPIDRGLEKVLHGTLPTVDLVQTALDVWSSPLTGKEQADYIITEVLGWRDGDEA